MSDQAKLRAAALHAVEGVIGEQTVPPGDYDLAGVEIVVKFGKGCEVKRSLGTAGEGFDSYTGTIKGLSLGAVLLFLQRSGAMKKGSKEVWKKAIRDAIAQGDKAEEHMPAAALEALAELKAEMAADPSLKTTRKTAARRIGLKAAIVDVRLPKPELEAVA